MILITDLDHTLAASAWRDQHKGDWDLYHRLAQDDKPIKPMINLINALTLNCATICITTRPEKWPQLTMTWLIKHDVKIHTVLMRPNDNFKPSPELKVQLIKSYFNAASSLDATTTEIVAIDDREDILNAYSTIGIKTLLRKL